jgi:hypothetical protein
MLGIEEEKEEEASIQIQKTLSAGHGITSWWATLSANYVINCLMPEQVCLAVFSP